MPSNLPAVPNFPTPPAKGINPSKLTMPSDLIADGRNFYTEIHFMDYRSAFYGQGSGIASALNSTFDSSGISAGVGGVAGAVIGAGAGALSGGLPGAIGGAVLGAVGGAGLGFLSATGGEDQTGAIRLPIPRSINDITTLNWETLRGIDIFGSLMPGLSSAVGRAGQGVGALVGKALNPLLFMAFNHQNFREFTFDWVLAPTSKKESQIIRDIVRTFKNSSLPTKNVIMDYPLIAMVRLFPNDLNQHMKFKPMAVQSVAVNYTPNPTGPSFFGNELRGSGPSSRVVSDGAPTMVTISVKFVEIQLFYRNDPDLK